MNNTVILFITLILTFISVFLPKQLSKNGKLSKRASRKIIHSTSGLGIVTMPYISMPYIIAELIVVYLFTLVTRKSSNKSKTKQLRELYDAIHEDEEENIGYLQGPFSYCLAIAILFTIFIFFPDRFYYPISAIFIVMYADAMASIIGRKYGTHHINIPWVGNKRTIEGSATFFIFALICSAFTFSVFGNLYIGNSAFLDWNEVILLSLLMSAITTILELLSPSKYDDFIVPIVGTILISLLSCGIGIW